MIPREENLNLGSGSCWETREWDPRKIFDTLKLQSFRRKRDRILFAGAGSSKKRVIGETWKERGKRSDPVSPSTKTTTLPIFLSRVEGQARKLRKTHKSELILSSRRRSDFPAANDNILHDDTQVSLNYLDFCGATRWSLFSKYPRIR